MYGPHPVGIPEGQRQGRTPFWREGEGGGSCPVPWHCPHRTCCHQWGRHEALSLGAAAGCRPRSRQLHSPKRGPALSASLCLAFAGWACTQVQVYMAQPWGMHTSTSVHGTAMGLHTHTHSSTLLYLSHCPLKSQNQAMSEEVRPPLHSH